MARHPHPALIFVAVAALIVAVTTSVSVGMNVPQDTSVLPGAGSLKQVRLECFELTSIINRAAETGRFYDKNGELLKTKGLRKDLSGVRDELSPLKEELSRARGDSAKNEVKKKMKKLLRSANCSSLMNEVGYKLFDLVNQQGITGETAANLLGREWLAPQGDPKDGKGHLRANGRISEIEGKTDDKGVGNPWKIVKEGEVQELCNKGAIVVGGWKNPNPVEDGHVVICAPEPERNEHYPRPLVRDGNEHVTAKGGFRPGSHGAIPSSAAFDYCSGRANCPTVPIWYLWKPSYDPYRAPCPESKTQQARKTKPSQKGKPTTQAKSGGSIPPYVWLGGAGGAVAAGAAALANQSGSGSGSSPGSGTPAERGTCISTRNCIVSVLGRPCSCKGTVNGPCNWTGPVAGQGDACSPGVPCRQGLSCNNGRCEGPQGRCPF
ncbi:MAG: hypothetical protein HYR55_11050 [Acidobacteria bacterium]|nr:hypothetical protein [Acidobacteriota bacterium]MBI3657715.1 hypothetical protein [Acidobacteriota bacterium]